MCSHSNVSPKIVVGRWCLYPNCHVHCAHHDDHCILAHVYGLLGPCFKTGRLNSQSLWHSVMDVTHARNLRKASRSDRVVLLQRRNTGCYPPTPSQRIAATVHHGPVTEATDTRFRTRSHDTRQRCFSRSVDPEAEWITQPREHISSHNEVPIAWSATISGTFNSLSKVLSTFPSRYLFTIVFGAVFSHRWNLPPN